MPYLPLSDKNWRSPRVRLAEITPAVLRLPDGRQQRGQLETVSLTGGLLAMPNMLDRGSRLKLLFLTRMGPVLGAVEMLKPVSTNHQPFRFVAFEEVDQRRLRGVIQSVSGQAQDEWIEKYRAAVAHPDSSQGIFRRVLQSLTVLGLLGSAVYLLNTHLLK